MAKRRKERGLTLIEILLALIVMAIGIVGILALFPTALNFAKTSMEETQGAMLSESVSEGLRNALRFSEVPLAVPGDPSSAAFPNWGDVISRA